MRYKSEIDQHTLNGTIGNSMRVVSHLYMLKHLFLFAKNGACDRGNGPFRVEILVDGLLLYFLFLANFSGPRGFRVLRRCRPRVHRHCLTAGGCDVPRCSYPAPCPWSGAEVRLKSRDLEIRRAGLPLPASCAVAAATAAIARLSLGHLQAMMSGDAGRHLPAVVASYSGGVRATGT